MTVAPEILNQYPNLNEAQRRVIAHQEGPLLVIAGPGSGKTYSIVLRALNLLLLGKAEPSQMVLCTFTEKAAFEMRDRIAAAARRVAFESDLSELHVTTIHGLCNRFIAKHRHHSPLGNNYETLDELTQLLFIVEHFDQIVGAPENDRFLHRWKTKWTAIEGARNYFDKITEELVEIDQLAGSADPFLRSIAGAYRAYESALCQNNRVDFAHLQRIAYDLLADKTLCDDLTKDIRYVLVDEYQDTNTVQEQLLLKLTEHSGNLCVVGDEDQSLYRFRGATVRNILEFPTRFSRCPVIKLTLNYRSHRDIIERYDRWMASIDWSNPNGTAFRYDKTIQPAPDGEHPEYPAVISIWGRDHRDEAQRFADLAAFLKKEGVVEDYSQIALLLHSVRENHSRSYLSALEARGIPAFCPRARAYFDNPEIGLMTACFALIFGWHGDGRGQLAGATADLAHYVDQNLVELAAKFAPPHPLAYQLRLWVDEIAALEPGQSLDLRPADYFYRLLAIDPFPGLLKNENRARNLAIFSQLLNAFQNYYHYNIVTFGNREVLRFHLFNSFFRLLYDGGINEYEDPDRPFPKDHVQVMTIHQAKGLEFPVVVVSSLSKQLSSAKGIDRDLAPFYRRALFEPENRITLFDRMRLHYVAFSRPQKLLVLTANEPPKDHFAPIWQGLPQWPYVETELLAAQRFALRERMPVKKCYSFTGDLKIYETCPRQYQFFREYDFTPSRSAVIFFGLLVHQTIEEIHRTAMDGRLDEGMSSGRIVITSGGMPRVKRYLDESRGNPVEDIWTDIPPINSQSSERQDYATQKPEAVLSRILNSLSVRPALVMDFFCGSGTTLAVAEKLGHRWIGCDLGRWAIHVTRKRLLGIENCKPFEVLNLGKYERQYWQGITFGEKKEKHLTEQALYEYLAFILKLYGAQPVAGLVHLHGKKSRAMVHIGAVDAPVTIAEIDAAVDECVQLKQPELHVLGWEWEMGLYDLMVEAAKKKGVKLVLLQIPREVMEQQAAAKGDVRFFELAYLEAEVQRPSPRPSPRGRGSDLAVQVALKDFVIPNTELIPDEVRTKIKKWSDYIDYWAVDWDFQNDTFMQGWVAFRTRKERKLPLVSDPHTYDKPGRHRILLKVIDIFGNDTSQAFDVEVPLP